MKEPGITTHYHEENRLHLRKCDFHRESSRRAFRVQEDEEEAQKIIYDYAGKGVLRNPTRKELANCEFVTTNKYVGMYYEKGGWHKTRRVQIMHSKYGAHLVPVKEL